MSGNHDSAIVDKLLGFLAAGASQTVAASAAGCSDGYVSQLVQEPWFLERLAELRSSRLSADIKHDDLLAETERRALEAVNAKLPFIKSAADAARVFSILNSARRQVAADSAASAGSAAVQQVTIVLPQAAAARIKINSSQQVIEVEGRSMAPMPSRALPALQKQVVEANLVQKDNKRATDLLNKLDAPMHTVIGGVVKVL